MNFEQQFIEKITQIVRIGPDIPTSSRLYREAGTYVFGYVPVDEKEGGPEELTEHMITAMVNTIRAELDASIGKLPRTPQEVEKRLLEYKNWRIRFADRPKIYRYEAKKQLHDQPWRKSKKIVNQWEEVIRMEGRWLYQRMETLYSTKVENA